MTRSLRFSTLFLDNLNEHWRLFAELGDLALASDAALMSTALQRGDKLVFCGYGESAADSQHQAAELTGRFVNDR